MSHPGIKPIAMTAFSELLILNLETLYGIKERKGHPEGAWPLAQRPTHSTGNAGSCY